MAVEQVRGCGFRKVGGLYIVGDGLGRPCDRMPIPLTVCPCCGAGIKQARGWTWINEPEKFLGGDHMIPDGKRGEFGCYVPGQDSVVRRVDGPAVLCPEDWCPVCRPSKLGDRVGLLWVGAAHYTPTEFMHEAASLGVSKRISKIPRGFKIGTWVLLAHPHAIPFAGVPAFGSDARAEPGIFYAFRPRAIEKIVTDSESKDLAEMDKLKSAGIVPVIVPDDDPDHR